jgi:asparagine synthase (glutamine-hydrolysing)
MCGITGIYSYKGVPVDESIIRRSTRSLAHRGPDDEGVFCEGSIAIGHRRLSIIDLSKAVISQ